MMAFDTIEGEGAPGWRMGRHSQNLMAFRHWRDAHKPGGGGQLLGGNVGGGTGQGAVAGAQPEARPEAQ